MRNFETAALHEQLRMRIAVSEPVPPTDSLYDFPTDQMTVYAEQAATTAPWPARTLATHGSDSTSRVSSFVLGFALASLIAWLGDIRAERPAATPADAVATMRTPVVTGATQETTDSRTASTHAEPAQPKSSFATVGYRSVLVLNSTPQGAEVVVNGKVVGQTPVVLSDQPVGNRALLVRRDGYSPWSTSVRIVADRETTVQPTLTPVP